MTDPHQPFHGDPDDLEKNTRNYMFKVRYSFRGNAKGPITEQFENVHLCSNMG